MVVEPLDPGSRCARPGKVSRLHANLEHDWKVALSFLKTIASCTFLLCALTSAQAQEETIRVGSVRSTASLATLIAVEKGYFKDAGIKVELTDLDTSTDSLAVVAQNRLQIVGGGLSAAYFNAVEKNLPVTLAFERVSSPLGHKLLVRSDLKDQIKGVAA